ncbi:hypothetical protein G6F29_004478 [Rhizopus arrhizus]|nr:hypothetical protein G6F30_004629 [Rhizopus arrhizus]KAG1428255.1 hypothetical protein G6F58_000646 [Rhizopus delemar]KAG0984846.1 hypothetical protein G6F29_004478 [Rhizopus arrhizus]KAG0995956.1 hypothetical protein G6F28_004303 [Rhizopus arrhizus]KAG1026536.1 hypothetical protein G6F26_004195 [Rhizopus arrhizus]
MDPHKKNTLPPPPSFKSAPDFSQSTLNIPSFSSAPDFTSKESKSSKREYGHESRSPKQYTSRSRSPTYRSSKRTRSRSPKRRRSRSPRRYRSRSPKRHRSRSPKQKRSSHDPSSKQMSRRSRRSPSPVPIHTGELKTGFTFIVDKRGDPDLVTYGTTHTYGIPSFRRSGNGRVLGYDWNERMTMNQGKAEIVDIRTSKPARYTDSTYTWKEMDKSMKRIHIKQGVNEEDPFSSSTAFIQLADEKSKKKKNDYESLVSTGVDYRSLEGNKVRAAHEEDEEEEEEEGESYNDMIRRRTIEFNQRLDQEPENVQLWLDFIQFQDEAAEGLSTTKNQTSLNEVKISIFQKALQHNPRDERLILAYLACGATIWDTLYLLREWDQQLKLYPGSIKLWSEYMNTRQTNFASFSFTECVGVFEDALRVLKDQPGSSREDKECLCVYVVLRACLMMKQAGYYERAYSIMQAIVEYNLFTPAGMTDKLNAFMEFWDGEVPRFGEEGAQGWCQYVLERTEHEYAVQHQEEEELESIKDWIKRERETDETCRLPMRMSQLEDGRVDEDPYRIVLFDDIQPFLFNISTNAARQTLIYSLFVFLGLVYTPPDVGTNTHFFTDTFTQNDLPLDRFWPPQDHNRPLVWYVSGVPMEPEQAVAEQDPFSIPPSYPIGLSELFVQQGHWFKALKNRYPSVDQKFTKNAFEQLLKLQKDVHLTLCYLSFESNRDYKAGQRLAKNLLKEERTNLVLWTAYAQMEKSHNKIDKAIYLTALSMYRTFNESEQFMAPVMYCMFAKLEMENDRAAEALKILVSMSTDTSYDHNTPLPTTPSVLKAREYFAQRTLQLSLLSDSEVERQVGISLVVCSALFEYLSSGLDHACRVFERALDYIKERQAERGYVSEIIMTEYANILYRHTKYHQFEGGFQPRIMRGVMERSIQLFPNNTMFFAFYIWNESRAKVFNRVQKLFNDSLSKESNVVLWLSAIYNELHRYKPYQTNLVRDLFERAIQDVNTKSSIIIWKNYIEFELMQKNIEKAKALFYRSLRDCPWSKELYLLGINSFKQTMDNKELNELASLMIEKEIRLRNPITDLI